jgi:hypothetical protein
MGLSTLSADNDNGKGKVAPVLNSAFHHEDKQGSGGRTRILTSALHGGERPAERVDRFTPRKKSQYSWDIDATGELLKVCTLHQMLLR